VRLITFAQLGPEKGISHCRDHVRRLVKVGKFPAPIQLSDHKIAWLEAEIDAMIAARPSALSESNQRCNRRTHRSEVIARYGFMTEYPFWFPAPRKSKMPDYRLPWARVQ